MESLQAVWGCSRGALLPPQEEDLSKSLCCNCQIGGTYLEMICPRVTCKVFLSVPVWAAQYQVTCLGESCLGSARRCARPADSNPLALAECSQPADPQLVVTLPPKLPSATQLAPTPASENEVWRVTRVLSHGDDRNLL